MTSSLYLKASGRINLLRLGMSSYHSTGMSTTLKDDVLWVLEGAAVPSTHSSFGSRREKGELGQVYSITPVKENYFA